MGENDKLLYSRNWLNYICEHIKKKTPKSISNLALPPLCTHVQLHATQESM